MYYKYICNNLFIINLYILYLHIMPAQRLWKLLYTCIFHWDFLPILDSWLTMSLFGGDSALQQQHCSPALQFLRMWNSFFYCRICFCCASASVCVSVCLCVCIMYLVIVYWVVNIASRGVVHIFIARSLNYRA